MSANQLTVAPAHEAMIGRHQVSWMARGAAKGDLLYVSSSGENKVYVFSYPYGSLVGTLTGFTVPMGLCVDRHSNVWVSNAGNYGSSGYLEEFAHGGTLPMAYLDETGESPVACSIDRKNGNLAAANGCPDYSCRSTVAVFTKAQGSPKQYSTGDIERPFEITYDNESNIFVAGFDGYYDHQIGWMPSGSSQFQIFRMKPHTHASHNVQWDGKYLAVAKADNLIHRYKIVDGYGQAVGGSDPQGCCGTYPMWFNGSNLIAGYGSGKVAIWAYPAGGPPQKTIDVPSSPYGVAVSAKP